MSERNLQRETAIYQAALGLIAQGASPAAMKVQDIAQAAGIGKGTVYEYFTSKEEILQGMALYCFDSEIAHIRPASPSARPSRDWRTPSSATWGTSRGAAWGPIRSSPTAWEAPAFPAGPWSASRPCAP